MVRPCRPIRIAQLTCMSAPPAFLCVLARGDLAAVTSRLCIYRADAYEDAYLGREQWTGCGMPAPPKVRIKASMVGRCRGEGGGAIAQRVECAYGQC